MLPSSNSFLGLTIFRNSSDDTVLTEWCHGDDLVTARSVLDTLLKTACFKSGETLRGYTFGECKW